MKAKQVVKLFITLPSIFDIFGKDEKKKES